MHYNIYTHYICIIFTMMVCTVNNENREREKKKRCHTVIIIIIMTIR